MVNYKKIDIHAHAMGSRGIPNGPGGGFMPLPEELMQIYKELNIERSVLLPEILTEYNLEIGSNRETRDIVAKYPETFSWFCNIDPRQGTRSPDYDFSFVLNYYKSIGARGVGEICANIAIDDPLALNLFKHCEACDMPVIFHMGYPGKEYGLCDDLGLWRLEKVLSMFPRLKFLGHSNRFWFEISDSYAGRDAGGYPAGKVTPGRMVELMRKYDNLHGDLSAGSGFNAIMRDPDFGYSFLEEFSDRLYYGTDICTCDIERALKIFKPFADYLDDGVENGKLSADAHYKICRGNAEKLLGLK